MGRLALSTLAGLSSRDGDVRGAGKALEKRWKGAGATYRAARLRCRRWSRNAVRREALSAAAVADSFKYSRSVTASRRVCISRREPEASKGAGDSHPVSSARILLRCWRGSRQPSGVAVTRVRSVRSPEVGRRLRTLRQAIACSPATPGGSGGSCEQSTWVNCARPMTWRDCTDARHSVVRPTLFQRFPSALPALFQRQYRLTQLLLDSGPGSC